MTSTNLDPLVEERAQELYKAIAAGHPFEAAVACSLLQITHGDEVEKAVFDRIVQLNEENPIEKKESTFADIVKDTGSVEDVPDKDVSELPQQ